MATDVQGRKFAVGQKVAKAAKLYVTDGLHVRICRVTKVEGDKVYLDGSTRALSYPQRVAILSSR